MSRILLACRLAFGALFIYTGLTKKIEVQEFAAQVFNYRILPSELVNAVALGLPALELVCGAALCTGFLARGAAVILNLLMAAFLGALIWVLSQGLDISCGCFAGANEPISNLTVARDLTFLAVGLAAMWGVFREAKVVQPRLVAQPSPASPPSPANQPCQPPQPSLSIPASLLSQPVQAKDSSSKS
jgi:putative oxidoreductase